MRETPEVTVLDRRVYRGGSRWSYEPAIHLLVDLGALEQRPTSCFPGFGDRLAALVPPVRMHHCSEGYAGGFLRRVGDGTWMGHVVEHTALALQELAGYDVARGKTRSAGVEGRYHVVFAYRDEWAGLAAAGLAVTLVNALVAARDTAELHELVQAYAREARHRALGPSTRAIVDAAERRGIPWRRVDDDSLVQLGHGVHQRRVRAAVTSSTSSIGVETASDKAFTSNLLDDAGLPVPGCELVRSYGDALAAAHRIGYPVVVKPLDGNHGRGVSLGVDNEAMLQQAFLVAEREATDGRVLVQQQVQGADHRLLVVGGRLVAAAERVPAHVVGDGEHSVAELVDIVNLDPRRGDGHDNLLTRIDLDDEAVALVHRQGLHVTDVPPTGRTVWLAQTANLSRGGTSIDRTDEVHPAVRQVAEAAARVVGLDVAGIDVVAPDLRAPLYGRGAIVEVNAGPGLRMHLAPSVGEPRPVGDAIVDLLFPDGGEGRVPLVCVTGTNGKTTTVRMVEAVLAAAGRTVGVTTTEGITVGGALVEEGDCSGPRSARRVLAHPLVDAAVLEVARGGVLRAGLGYDRSDVGVVLNVTADHLGLDGIETLDDLADVKQVVIEAVAPGGTGVLNADDERVTAMARLCRGTIIFFSMQPDNPVVASHLRNGGRAVVLGTAGGREHVVLADGHRSMPLLPVAEIVATWGGRARMNVANALAATASCWGLGLPASTIAEGLRRFRPAPSRAAGRVDVVDAAGTTVIVDYGHNPAAMAAIGELVERFCAGPAGRPDDAGPAVPAGGRGCRAIGVIGTAGDRRDEDLARLGAVAATSFDVVVVREDEDRRGRAPGETATHILAGIRGAAPSRCRDAQIVLDEAEAVAAALALARPGDVVALCVEDSERAHDLIAAMAAARESAAAVDHRAGATSGR